MGYKIHLADYDIKLKTQRQEQQIHISGTTFSITAYLHSPFSCNSQQQTTYTPI